MQTDRLFLKCFCGIFVSSCAPLAYLAAARGCATLWPGVFGHLRRSLVFTSVVSTSVPSDTPDVPHAGLCREGRNVWTKQLHQGTWLCVKHSAGGLAPGSCDLDCGCLPSETKHGWSLNSRKHGDPSLVSEVRHSLILSRTSSHSCCSSSALLCPQHFSTLCFRNRN